MRLLVIGHSVEDHIHQNNDEVIKPGGIYYAALGLSKIITKNDESYLVTALQKNNYHLFSDVYDKMNKKYFVWADEIPKVHLFIYENEERSECYTHIPKQLEINYGELNNFDGILVNMVSGFEISLSQLKEIRKNFNGLMYFDVHTFSRGFDSNNQRVFRTIENFSEWAKQVDIIQANEHETVTLFNINDETKTAMEVLKLGTKYFIVTKGELGVTAYFLQSEKLNSISFPAIKVKTVNKVGCGDIFGSVFFYNFLKTRNVHHALKTANFAAGVSASTQNLHHVKF